MLEPVDAARWTDLTEQVGSTPPEPRSANPAAVVSGRVPGGSFTADVQLGTMSVFGSDVVTCESSIMVRTNDGDLRGGGESSGECSEHGRLSAMTLEDGGVLFVGELPSVATAVELVLPDGSVVQPELVGEERRLFAHVEEGATFPTAATVLGADGRTVAVLAPDDGMWQSITGGGWGSSSGRAFVSPG